MGSQPQLKGPDGTSPRATSEDCWLRLNADALHDLSSPVNQIGTLAELIVKKYKGVLGEEGETLFGFLQTSVGRLQNLVGGLNNYLRVAGAPGARRLCDSDLLVTAARASVQAAIDQNGAVVTHDPLPLVYCDPNQIGYAFRSLLENAIKFRREQRPEVHISAAEAGDTWIFSVRDNGIGIDPAYRHRIFGLFKRLHNEAYRGAGMGLAITRQIVEEHGGQIWVESQSGLGSTFFFSLPRAAS
jgi:chemotaxis family two-component system sensor kinase Cph1